MSNRIFTLTTCFLALAAVSAVSACSSPAACSLQPFVTSPADFSALIRRDYDKYGKLVREIGVRAD